jgi:cephalosporin hydroxylase
VTNTLNTPGDCWVFEENLGQPVAHLLPVIQRRILQETRYFGIPTLKNPFDFWVYQEILFETRPDFIVEIGNFCGGSALALAHLCDALGQGQVIGVDIDHSRIAQQVSTHPRIVLIEGPALSVFDQVAQQIPAQSKVMIIEDSLHTFEHTLSILETYQVLVPPGHYFIVEDSICHHGLPVGPKPGPYEAIIAFTDKNADFMIDRQRESFGLTWNPKGFLRRVQAPALDLS